MCSLMCMHGGGIPREENSCDIKVEVGLTGKRKKGTGQRGLGNTGDSRGGGGKGLGERQPRTNTKHACVRMYP